MNSNISNNNLNQNNDLQRAQDSTTVTATNEQAVNSNGNTHQQIDQIKVKKKKPTLIILLLLIIASLCFYNYYSYTLHERELAHLKDECTPVSTSGETKELDINSTIVQDLYSKVKTNIREDLANFDLNDEMKLYLAYREIPTSKIYDSNCNYFNDAKMPSYTCKDTSEFTPKAFKQEDLTLEVKKLFGESTEIAHNDIQLGITCLGGYQYIADRGEYVSGECSQLSATTFKADKELIKATSTESQITIYEKVRYYGSEGKTVPEKLISGTYRYTFKLDMNYNYIYISKELEV